MKKRIPKEIDYTDLDKDAKPLASVLENLDWHSTAPNFKQFKMVTCLLNNEYNRSLFHRLPTMTTKGRLFIHKENKSLWMFTKTCKYIVAVFKDDGIEVEID